MATDVGSLQARLFLDNTKFHSGMEASINDARTLGATLQNAFNGLSPDQATVVKKAQQLSQTLSNIFSKTQATVKLSMDASNFENTAHEVNEWVSGLKEQLSTGLSDVTPHVNISEAQNELNNLKTSISDFRSFADQQLHDIRPSIHIGNANRSLNTVRQNIESLRTNAAQAVNMTANIDTSGALSSLQGLVAQAQQIGQEISNALGQANPTSFYQTSSAMQSMAQAMEVIITRATAFESALQNMNQTLQQVSAVRTFTSQLSQEFNNMATAAENAAASVSNLSNQIWELVNILEVFTGDQSYFFSDMTSQIDGMASAASRFSASMQSARAQMGNAKQEAKSLGPNVGNAANEANKLQNHMQSSVHWADRLKQIIGGIVISQAFYQITGMIRSWIGMANEFAMEMEQAAISFKYLMGSAEEANSFIQALQDFAVESPLDTAGAEKSARMLMTMGIAAKNTIPVLRVLTDTATVAGGEIEDTVYRISLALGQMLQSGTVKMQEIRQLVNANIPIYTILQEELGLTAKQVSQIGKEGVNSAKAVNAILRGLQKRFGGAAKEMQTTVKGALNAIKDSFMVLYNTIISGPYEWLRSRLVAISEVMTKMVAIIRRVGPGGLFEALFPPEQQAIIRNLIGAFGQLASAIKYTAILMGYMFGDAIRTLAYWLNIILPPIAIFLNGLMQLALYLYKNVPLIRMFVGALGAVFLITRVVIPLLTILWKILGLAKVWTFATRCVQIFGSALAWLVAHPIALCIAGILALLAVIGYITGAFNGLISKIKGVISWWTSLNKTLSQKLNLGYDPNKILQPWKDKGVDNNSKDYLGRLQDIQDTMGDIGDEADKTKKKLKNSFLQSFDEVYQIKPKEDDTAQTAADLGLDDYDFPIQIFDDIPTDLTDMIGDLGSALDDLAIPGADFWDKWKKVFSEWPDWLAPLLGASLGAIIGAALGGVPGAIIGAAIGALVGWLWDKIADAFQLTPEQRTKAAITSGICAGLGAILGYIVGGPLGAAIGAVVGTFVGEFWSILCDKFKLHDVTRYAGPIATAIAGGIGFALGNVPGLIVGTTIGAIITSLIEAIATGIESGDWSKLSVPIGGGLGAALGGVLGGPVGAVVGGAIGMLVGGLWQKLYEAIKNKFGLPESTSIADIVGGCISAGLTGFAGAFWRTITTPLVNGLGQALLGSVDDAAGGFILNGVRASLTGALKGGILGAVAGLAGGLLSNALNGWVAKELDRSKEDLDNGAIGQSIGGLIGGIAGLIITGGNPIGAAIGTIIGQIIGGFAGLFASDVKEKFSKWWSDIVNGMTKAFSNFNGTFMGIWNTVKGCFSTAFNGVKDFAHNIGYYAGDILGHAVGLIIKAFTDIDWADIGAKIKTGLNNLWTAITTYDWSKLGQDILTGIQTGWQKVTTWFSGVGQAIADFFKDFDLMQIGSDLISGLWNGITAQWQVVWEYIKGLFEGFIDGVKDVLGVHSPSTIFAEIGGNLIQGLWNGIQAIWQSFMGFITGILGGLFEAFNGFATNLSTWATNTWTTITNWATNVGTTISTWATTAATTISTWVTDTMTNIGNWVTTVGTNIATWATNATTNIGNWVTNTGNNIKNWVTQKTTEIQNWATTSATNIATFASTSMSRVSSFVSTTTSKIGSWASTTTSKIGSTVSTCISKISTFTSTGISKVGTFVSTATSRVGTFASNFTSKISSAMSTATSRISSFCSTTLSKLSSWASSVASKISSALSSAASAVSSAVSSASSAASNIAGKLARHATGGIYNREHLAMISEGNKSEAIIPLQNQTAMQPFVDAVSQGLTESLAPILANMHSNNSNSGGSNLQPLYVGTLIADERGLKELERKMRVIQVKEDRRRS